MRKALLALRQDLLRMLDAVLETKDPEPLAVESKSTVRDR